MNHQQENSPAFPHESSESISDVAEHKYLKKDLIVILILAVIFLIVLLVIYYLNVTTDLIERLSTGFLSTLTNR